MRSFVALLLLMALVSCSDAGGTRDTSQSGTTSTAAATTSGTASTTTRAPTATTGSVSPGFLWDYTDPDLLPLVTLLEAGDAPRAVRMFSPRVGDSMEATMEFTFDVSQATAESTTRVETVITIDITTEILQVDDQGIVSRVTFGDFEVSTEDEATAAELAAAYEELRGATLVQLTSPQGDLLATESGAALLGTEIFTSGFGGATAPLPLEPVGVNAVWEVVGTIESGGIEFVQTTTVRLTSVDGSRITLETLVVQELGPEGFVVPGVPADAIDAELASTGSGSATWDLASLVALEAESEITQELRASITVDGETANLEQTVRAVFRQSR